MSGWQLGPIGFEQPLWLLLLPLALLPLLAPAGRPMRYSWLALLPRDPAADLLRWLLRVAGALALLGVLIGVAGPFRPEYSVEKVGQGAEIVLLLDRSRSMDQGFGRSAGKAPAGTGPEALDYYFKLARERNTEPKGKVARQILGEFAARRPEDRFAMTVFSTLPMPVLGFTQKPEAIQAAISAGNIGRGLSDTDIGLALQSALKSFEGRPYTGSRIVLLVSDGGDHIEPDARQAIEHEMRRLRVSLYWIYIRSANSPGLMADADAPPSAADGVPEYFLHRFFQSLGTPYRAYEADNPEALQKAIEDVNRLENLPITYLDSVPRRELDGGCYGLAFGAVLLLFAASLMEIRRWA